MPACSARPARSAAARWSSQGNCSYASAESGAVFSFAPGGVLQGGVTAPAGSSFAAAARVPEHLRERAPRRPYSTRSRTSSTRWACSRARAARRPMPLPCGCAMRVPSSTAADTVTRQLHDLRRQLHPDREGLHQLRTPRARPSTCSPPRRPAAPPPPAARSRGSMVIGLVNGAAVPLHLVRESTANQGMRLLRARSRASRPARRTAATPMLSVQGESARGHGGRHAASTWAARPRR